MFKKKSSDEAVSAENREEGQKKTSAEKYSVTVYVVIMAIAFTCLILLSYFISQRNANQMIQDMNQQHTQVQTKALDNIEALQDANMKLTEMVQEYDERITELESQNEEQEKELSDASAKNESIKEELEQNETERKLQEEMISYANAVLGNDLETAAKLSQNLEGKKGSMSTEMMSLYGVLRIQQAQKEAAAKAE